MMVFERMFPSGQPYSDWAGLRERLYAALPRVRAQSVMMDIMSMTDSEVEQNLGDTLRDLGIEPMEVASGDRCRKIAAVRVMAALDERSASSGEAPDYSFLTRRGIRSDSLCRVVGRASRAESLDDVYPLGMVPPTLLAVLSKELLNISPHMLYFGERGKVLLPKAFSRAAGKLIADPKAKTLMEDILSRIKTEGEKPYGLMLKERIYHQKSIVSCAEEYARVYFAGSIGWKPTSEAPRKVLAARDEDLAADKMTLPALRMLMYYSLATGQSLDVFLCQNYISDGSDDILYERWEPGSGVKAVEKITDEKTLALLGRLLELPQARQSQVLGKFFASIL